MSKPFSMFIILTYFLIVVPCWKNSPTFKESHHKPWQSRSNSSRLFCRNFGVFDRWGKKENYTSLFAWWRHICFFLFVKCRWCNHINTLWNCLFSSKQYIWITFQNKIKINLHLFRRYSSWLETHPKIWKSNVSHRVIYSWPFVEMKSWIA